MSALNIRKEIKGEIEPTVSKLTELLKAEGFGVLTRIDLHEKFKEKLGKVISPTVILGACNPALAYEAFTRDTDIASLIPCNAVVRQLSSGVQSIELVRPSYMMTMLGGRDAEANDPEMTALVCDADERLARVLAKIGDLKP